MGGRHQLAQQRQYYAKRRLAELRAIYPDLPKDALSHMRLRELSFVVRRAGRGQTALKAEAEAQENNGNGIHAKPEVDGSFNRCQIWSSAISKQLPSIDCTRDK